MDSNKQLLLDARYLRMAQIWAENSYCRRRQVGALLVKDKMIISDGYNGTPVGFENGDSVTGNYAAYEWTLRKSGNNWVICSDEGEITFC